MWLNPFLPNGFADHYPVFKWLFHWEYTLFSDKPKTLRLRQDWARNPNDNNDVKMTGDHGPKLKKLQTCLSTCSLKRSKKPT